MWSIPVYSGWLPLCQWTGLYTCGWHRGQSKQALYSNSLHSLAAKVPPENSHSGAQNFKLSIVCESEDLLPGK